MSFSLRKAKRKTEKWRDDGSWRKRLLTNKRFRIPYAGSEEVKVPAGENVGIICIKTRKNPG